MVQRKKNFSLTIFFFGTIAPRRTRLGSSERARRALYAHIFFDQIGPIHLGEPDRGRLKELVASSTHIFFAYRSDQKEPIYNGNNGKKNFSLTIFFSGTKAPRRTRLVSLESARRALYAHIFVIFLSETIAPRRTGPGSFHLGEPNGAPTRTGLGSLERARRALYAHIFFVQIGPIGAEWNKGKKNFSFAIFFSETIAPRRTGPGSFERARRALYAHIFFVQIGPIGAELLQFKDNKGKKHFYLRIFLSETIAPRRTGPRSFESARRALYAYIFLHLGEPDWGHWKVLVAPSTPIFLCTDRTNRSRFKGNIGKKHCSLRIFLSETIAPRRTGPGSFHLGEPDRGRLKELVASSTHIFFAYRSDQKEPIYNGNNGKKNFSLTIFFSGTKAPRRTRLVSLESARRALYAHIFVIFLSETIAPRRTGPGSFHLGEPNGAPTRTGLGSLERARRALYAHIFFVQIGPIGAEWNKGKKNFSFAIFFSETIAPRRTGPGSFERARRALYAHIFFVQIGPIGAELLQFKDNKGKKHFYLRIFLSETIAPRRTGPRSFERPRRTLRGSLERARQALYAHIFFVQIGTIGADTLENRTGVHLGEPDWCHWKVLVAPSTPIFLCTDRTNRSRFKGNKGKKHCSLRIFLSETIAPRRTGPGSFENLTGVIGKGSSSPLRTYFFRPDRNNRSRVITHLGEPDWCHWKVLIAPSTPIFLCTDRTNRSRFKGNKGKKHCSLRIFLPETIAPRRTGPGSFHLGEPDWCHWKVLVAPSTPIFLCTDRTNRSRFKGNKGKKHCSLRIFLSETIAPRRTGPGSFENLTGVIGKGSSSPLRTYFFRPDRNNRSRVITHLGEPDWCHWKVLVAPSTPIFLCTDRTNRCRFKGHKGKKHCSLRIFLSETIAPRRTGPGSFENLTGVIGKGSSSPLRTYFFRPDRNNRSRVITHLGEPDWCHWKVLVAPSTPIFLCTDRTNRSRFKGNKGKKHCSLRIFLSETIAPRRTGPGSFHLGEPYGGHWKGLVKPSTHIFFSSRSEQ
ncbi:LOW QUALITY PROTEIN: hypothetical protein V1477_006725 [Vespula maculifrons]|uniref:Uncharacterized protein n=1 Tax=Vespula maculifrons TaxID=7453 RepID=A0ABD2CIX0_VESMC